jgi:hypothetical protein
VSLCACIMRVHRPAHISRCTRSQCTNTQGTSVAQGYSASLFCELAASHALSCCTGSHALSCCTRSRQLPLGALGVNAYTGMQPCERPGWDAAMCGATAPTVPARLQAEGMSMQQRCGDESPVDTHCSTRAPQAAPQATGVRHRAEGACMPTGRSRMDAPSSWVAQVVRHGWLRWLGAGGDRAGRARRRRDGGRPRAFAAQQ